MVAHPRGDALPHALLKGVAEGAVAAVAAVVGQLLGGERLARGDGLMVAADEVLDAQAVDVGIVCEPLLGEESAQVGVVGADSLGELRQGEVVLQVELCGYAMLFQQLLDLCDVDVGDSG